MNTNTHSAIRPPGRHLMALEAIAAPWEHASTLAWWPLLRMAPRGDGHPVLVIPGLGASDSSTLLLRQYLSQQGHATYAWQLGANLGPQGGKLRALRQRIVDLDAQHGRRVSLIGWSLGGIYARELAKTRPHDVRSVITLGAPFTGSLNATSVARSTNSRPARRSARRVSPPSQREPRGTDDVDLEPHRRCRGLAMQRARDGHSPRTSRCVQPHRHGREPVGAVCPRRPAGAAGRPVEGVRQEWLAAPGLSLRRTLAQCESCPSALRRSSCDGEWQLWVDCLRTRTAADRHSIFVGPGAPTQPRGARLLSLHC